MWHKMGYWCIVIWDNLSTYPPLLDYYYNESTRPGNVILNNYNGGATALFMSQFVTSIRSQYFAVTDSDLVFADPSAAEDFVSVMVSVLDSDPDLVKAGSALDISDIPEHYPFRAQVLGVEAQHWETSKMDAGLSAVADAPVFRTGIDTTLAIYRGNYLREREHLCVAGHCGAVAWYEETERSARVGGRYTMKHLPWYQESDKLPRDVVHALVHKGLSWKHGSWSAYMSNLLVSRSHECWGSSLPLHMKGWCCGNEEPVDATLRGQDPMQVCFDEVFTYDVCCGGAELAKGHGITAPDVDQLPRSDSVVDAAVTLSASTARG
mmetsp:Transcript_38513/g.86508  ORF Transcript_38513/g.86508 Transcript_38513/m.86508 type:complete len:322 (-) Transcript_38513:256-1221(-)